MRNIPLKSVFKTAIIIFILLFILVAIFSVRVFISTKQQTHDAYLAELAVTEASTIAETLKSANGDPESTVRILTYHKKCDIKDDKLILYYDDKLSPCVKKKASYKTVVTCEYFEDYNHYSIIINTIDDKETLYSIDFKYLSGGNPYES